MRHQLLSLGAGPVTPTEEQEAARLLFELGDAFVVQAGAGTGKTTTLAMLAQSTPRVGTYVAFNRAIVGDARSVFPLNVDCSTAHGLAFKAIGHQFQHRLRAPRIKSSEIARLIDAPRLRVDAPTATKILAPGFTASLAVRAVRQFCVSADEHPGAQHVPRVPALDLPGTSTNNDALAEVLAPCLEAVWRDFINPAGVIPWNRSHDAYLKVWSLGSPRIPGEFVLVDEAQDLDPAMLVAVARSAEATGQQVVLVGDSQQAIYAWRNAVDALERAGIDRRCYLTMSWRFGPRVAEAANVMLEVLGSPLRLTGNPDMSSRLQPVASPDAILQRTNAAVLGSFLKLADDDRRPHIVGGADDLIDFARAANELRDAGWTPHPDLSCFDSWSEALEYADADPQGSDISLMVKMLEEYGIEIVLSALEGMIAEANADVLVSTAHRAKGREWPAVRVGGDFPDDLVVDAEEARLVYVALTRAQEQLDLRACAPFTNARAGHLTVRDEACA